MCLRFGVLSDCDGGCDSGCGGDGCDGCGSAARDPFAMIIKRVLSASKCRIDFVP